jgi:hypothetical protein
MQTALTLDDFDFIITIVADASQDILHKHESKKEEMYDRIEVELRGVQQALQSNHIVSTVPPLSEALELEDEISQLRIIADATKAHLHHAHEETKQATKALNKVQKVVIEKCQVVQKEKASLQANFEEEKEEIQQEKEQFLTEKVGVKEALSRALISMTGLDKKKEDQWRHWSHNSRKKRSKKQ